MEYEIGWLRLEFGHQLGTGAARADVDTGRAEREDPGIVVGAASIGPPLYHAVHDGHPCLARGGKQPGDVGKRLAARFVGERLEPGVEPDDRALTLLGDDRRVSGRHQVGQGDLHAVATGCPVGGTS